MDGHSRRERISASPESIRAAYRRHLSLDHVVAPDAASDRQRFTALASAIRDLLAEQWLETTRTHDLVNPKRVY